MVMEDLQQIIPDFTPRGSGRRTLLIISGIGVLLAATLLGLIIGVVYLSNRGTEGTGNNAYGYSGLIATKGAKDVCLNSHCLKASAW